MKTRSETVLERLTDFLYDDMEDALDYVEYSSDPIMKYLNSRVDTVMESVHREMENPGSITLRKICYYNSAVIRDFTHMMLAVPVLSLLFNFLGIPSKQVFHAGYVVSFKK